MIDKLIQFLNLSEDQLKQFENLKEQYESENEQLDAQLRELWKQRKESWKNKKSDFENILNEEQKERMHSLLELFSPRKRSKKSGFKGCKA